MKEQHKAALWGFVQQALATFSENPENLHQHAVRKVLGDNLLLAMGTMLGRSAADYNGRKRQPSELSKIAVPRAGIRAGEYVGAADGARSV
ncbi:transcriptional regulator EutR [Citrobacter koseri]|uniref:Transcriptional regulator EutR n=1 Tax=Citrobacter koseri TaxID=545 RepID=A0A2X2VS64_CITKO|nr:transcriptional regulator EutR [Citrobacter koseri]